MRSLVITGLVLLLSGCFQQEPVPEGLPTDDKGNVLPTVHGFVVDEAVRPMADVEVRFLGTNVTTKTDQNGEYEIFAPVASYHSVLVTALKPGFIARTAQVQISAHISARQDFGLAVNPYAVPHVDVLNHRGTRGCEANLVAAGQTRRQSCDPPSTSTIFGDAPPRGWWLNPTPGLAGVVVQVVWNPSSPLAEKLHVTVRAPVAGGPHGSQGAIIAETTAASPIRLEIPEAQSRALSEWTAIVVTVQYGNATVTEPVTISQKQIYQVFATLFYVDPAPPGYTLN